MWEACLLWVRHPLRKVEQQVKALVKNLAIFFLWPSQQFLLISFQIQLLEYFPLKTEETKTKAARVLIGPYKLTVYILLHRRDWIRSSRKIQLGPGKQRGKTWFGLEKRKKISQIINEYLFLPLFLLIILETYRMKSLISLRNKMFCSIPNLQFASTGNFSELNGIYDSQISFIQKFAVFFANQFRGFFTLILEDFRYSILTFPLLLNVIQTCNGDTCRR